MPAELGRYLPGELVDRLEEQRQRVMVREIDEDGDEDEGLMRRTTYLRGSDGTSTVNTKGLEGKLARAGGLDDDDRNSREGWRRRFRRRRRRGDD